MRTIFAFLLVSAAALPPLTAQPYTISTLAGGAPAAVPARGVDAQIGYGLQSVAADGAGNAYFASGSSVLKLDPSGALTRVAGNGRQGYSGDGGPATSAQFSYPQSVAVDGAGNLFIADVGNDRIRRVAPSGVVTTVAGDGTSVQLPGLVDGAPAASSPVGYVTGIAVDATGNLFILEENFGIVRKIGWDGIITTVAGKPAVVSLPSTGDGGPATSAQLYYPSGIAVDSAGNLFITSGDGVRKVSAAGIITTVAGGTGNTLPDCLSDGVPATKACLGAGGIAADGAGNLYIAASAYQRIRKVSPSGIITTVAGSGSFGGGSFSGDGGPATAATLNYPRSVALDSSGNLFILDSSNARVRKVTMDGIINTVAGNGGACCVDSGGFSGDGGPATTAQFNYPADVAVDAAGNVFIADNGNGRVRKVSPGGIVTTVAGNGTFCAPNGCTPAEDGGPAINAQVSSPWGLAVDRQGNLLIADAANGRIRKVSPDGVITTAAGGGTPGSGGDGGPAVNAQMFPSRVAADGAGNLFIMDAGTRIRKVSPDGTISSIAGNGKCCGLSGDGGPATSAQLDAWDPGGCDGPGGGMAADGAGDLFFADSYNHEVREVASNGIITKVAGTGGGYCSGPTCPPLGDGGPAAMASLEEPFAVAFDSVGNLFIADTDHERIRKVSQAGVISTVAGNGVYGYSGDGGAAESAVLGFVSGIAVDGSGNIFLAEPYNNAVRVLRPAKSSVLIGTVVDAASQRAGPVSPGKIVVIYGAGLGPAQLTTDPNAGTEVSFNGAAASLLYASATQVAAAVPASISGSAAQVTVSYNRNVSNAVSVPVALSSPSLFTLNQTGAGQAAATNADGSTNTAAKPAKIGEVVSLYATGAGQGNLSVSMTIGGIPATIQYAGSAPVQNAGLMQVNVQVPNGVQPGGYVPVVLKVGDASSTDGAVWIAVSK